MNVSDALEIERGIVFKQGYCKEKSLQKVVLSSKDFRAGFYQPKALALSGKNLKKVTMYILSRVHHTIQNNFEVEINIATMHIVNFPSRHAHILCKHSCIVTILSRVASV